MLTKRAVLLAVTMVCLSGRAGASSILSGQNHQDDRAGTGRWADRCAGALSWAAHPDGAGTERDRRQPCRRRRRDRGTRGRDRRARRLHDLLRQHEHARGHSGGLEKPRLRPEQELCADRKRVGKLHDPGGAPLVSGENRAGVHRLREGQSRQAQLRQRRRRQRHAPDRRDAAHTRRRSISSTCRTRAAPSRSPRCSASRSISRWKAR